MNEVHVRLFGAFRNMQSEPVLSLWLGPDIKTAGDLRTQLAAHWSAKEERSFDVLGLLKKSAIATDREVLEDEALLLGQNFALLPPVSGG